MKNLLLGIVSQVKAFEDIHIVLLAVPRRVAGKQNFIRAVAQDNFTALFGIEPQHGGGVHPHGCADQLLQYLVEPTDLLREEAEAMLMDMVKEIQLAHGMIPEDEEET